MEIKEIELVSLFVYRDGFLKILQIYVSKIALQTSLQIPIQEDVFLIVMDNYLSSQITVQIFAFRYALQFLTFLQTTQPINAFKNVQQPTGQATLPTALVSFIVQSTVLESIIMLITTLEDV
jgi:hypothetical protein